MNYLKKVGLGSNFFKKAERTGNNIFKKVGSFVDNLPNVANQVGSTVKNIANEIQKKTAQYAPALSSLAYATGNPLLGASIGATAMKLNNFANNATNAVNNAQNLLSQ
jgi:restriction endonuclease S subunit